MTGPVRSRFLAHLPARAFVHPLKLPPKFFVKKNLPITPTRTRICAGQDPYPQQNEEFTKKVGGGGYPSCGRSARTVRGSLKMRPKSFVSAPLPITDAESIAYAHFPPNSLILIMGKGEGVPAPPHSHFGNCSASLLIASRNDILHSLGLVFPKQPCRLRTNSPQQSFHATW